MIRKSKGTHLLQPAYLLYEEARPGDPHPHLVMIAKKKLVNNTYYLFDVSGVAEYDPNVILARLSKTSPERVGKLCAIPKSSAGFVVYGLGTKEMAKPSRPLPTDALSHLRPELAAMTFAVVPLASKLVRSRASSVPRRGMMLVPPPPSPGSGLTPGFRTVEKSRTLASRMLEKRYEPGMTLLTSKEPSLLNHTFQLNFGGRVKVPSVKNFQLVNPAVGEHVVQVQFGKVSGHKYILDYKEPLCRLQAFAFALCQFIV